MSAASSGVRRLIVFADGTGNAFSAQESNVWRLYEALDKSDPTQLAYYIQGVGTASFKPLALLDGATGLGVPSNVRKLYRFICENCTTNTEIYMFGFSRGSFTIRTLVGLIEHEGILAKEIGGEPVSRAAMRRNAMAAWRAYRRKSYPTFVPTILFTRLIRDIILGVYHFVLGHKPYYKVRPSSDQTKKIKFLGLFDTVEAYGVPIEELRSAIDWTIWPISFRNFELSKKVEQACHALSLDDERTTFHPLRIERLTEDDRKRIEEVWFAGVHSDVGGGYPEGELSLIPLCWMLDRALKASSGPSLQFNPNAVAAFRSTATPFGPVHDSRSGTAVFYRYDPRTIGSDARNGGAAVVHHSVAMKIALGDEQYAPIMLQSTAQVLMPNGKTYAMDTFDAGTYEPAGATPQEQQAVQAVSAIRNPSKGLIAWAHDLVWWRRVFYYLLLLSVFAVAALPWIAGPIAHFAQPIYRTIPFLAGNLEDANNGISGFFTAAASFIGAWLPSWTKTWVDVLAYWPLPCLAVIAVAVWIYLINGSLRDRIADRAYQAWLPQKLSQSVSKSLGKAAAKNQASGQNDSVRQTFAHFMRHSKVSGFIHRLTTRIVLPAISVICIVAIAITATSRTTTTYRDGAGTFCTSTPEAEPAQPGVAAKRQGFSLKSLCWASSIKLRQGRSYRVWIVPNEKDLFFDKSILTTPAGFNSDLIHHISALWMRRWFFQVWFQPIGRIGNIGNTTWALTSEDGDLPGEAEDNPSLAQRGKPFVTKFVAQQDGEFFLYVNDAIISIPFGPTITFFYLNNEGTADVWIEELPAKPVPQ